MPFLLPLLLLRPPNPSGGEARQPPQTQPASRQQQAPTQQRGTDSTPLVIKLSPPQVAEIVAAQKAQERQQESSTEGRLVLFTGLLVLVGVGQLGVFWYQAVQLRRTVDAATDQSKKLEASIAANTRVADAMEGQLDATRVGITEAHKNAVRELRAYITVQTVRLTDQKDGLHFEWEAQVKNSGKTPARNVVVHARLDVFSYPLPPEQSLFIHPPMNPTKTLIGPGQHSVIIRSPLDPVPEGDLADIRNLNGKALFFHGTVWYTDIYKELHHVSFCQYGAWNTDGSVGAPYMTERNNDEDENG